jgi:beta-N-acetylhexosaminidase
LRIRLALPVSALLVLLAAGCARAPLPRTNLASTPADVRWVEKTLRRLTLEEKVGQLIACRFAGDFRNLASPELGSLRELIVRSHIGGVILFGGEVYETATLTNLFQSWARLPLLVASDFERGVGNQVTNATLFPPLMALGAAGSEELAYEMGKATAIEGRAMGVHMTYAPVVDVNVNPLNPIINTRSVGEDPELVSRIARAFIRGCQENGMVATAKHYPGHGDTAQDSHTELPTIAGDRDRLERVELYPFRQAVAAGVQAIMSSHLFVPALDPTPGLPATLSPAIMTDLLRKTIGFRGLLVTDAMEMAGVTRGFGPEEAAKRAILAGIDMVLLPPEPARVAAYLAVEARAGRLPVKRIDEAVRRILLVKARLGLPRQRLVDLGALATRIAPPVRLAQAWKTFEAAVTLVRNEGDVLPLAPGKRLATLSLSSDPGDYFAGRAFVQEMIKRHPGSAGFYADGDTGQESLDEAAAQAATADAVVVALFSRLGAGKGSVDLEPRHVALVQKLAACAPPVIVLSFGSPYFLRHFPDVDAYVCLYRNTPETQPIAARALCGQLDIGGKLPVSLPGLYPVGHGLTLRKVK